MACGTRHQMYPVTDISGWFHRTGPQHLVPVHVWAQEGDIWLPGHCRFSRKELTSRIRDAGGVGCAHALEARRLLAGGIEMVPVKMDPPSETEPGWAWEP